MIRTKEYTSRFPRLAFLFIRGALPIVLCLLLLGLGAGSSPSSSMTVIAVCAVCAIILWFGWNSVRRNIVTKWIGVLLAIYLALVLGLSALGIAIGLSLVLLPLFFVVLPLLLYDLLFRAPSEG